MFRFVDRVSNSQGYTLIEIMMATLIIFVVVTGGVAAFRQFDERQSLTNSGRNFSLDLRETQKKAQSGEKPDACRATQSGGADKELEAWIIRINDRESYQVRVLCSGQRYDIQPVMELENGLTFASTDVNKEVIFEVLTGKLRNNQSTTTITLESNNRTYRIEVSPVGGISESVIRNGEQQ